MKTVGFVCQSDPYRDRGAWSGSIYKLREAIEDSGYHVLWIPVKPNPKLIWILSHLLRIINRHTILYTAYPAFLRSCARSIDMELVEQCDILFFPGLAGIMKYVKLDKPFIYFTDATFCQMLNYYWFGLDKLTIHYGHKSEIWAISNCSIKISSSHWAAHSAEVDYGCARNKNFVIPFGANIDEDDMTVKCQLSNGKYKFLFSGVEWERKGATIAIDAVKELNNRGYDIKLIMCGIRQIPEDYGPLPDCVEFLGFLNKNVASEYQKYVRAVNESAALILPTKAECAGIVFCEAAGNGLPVFTYDTGGIADYVINGKNGYRLPLESDAKDFADAIEDCIKTNKLKVLSEGAKNLYRSSLNWSKWSQSFRSILDDYFVKNG